MMEIKDGFELISCEYRIAVLELSSLYSPMYHLIEFFMSTKYKILV